MDILILVVAFVVILLGAELFTNGIEWFGRKLELAEGAVGSVLAAVGTALPETMIPIIAILFATGESSNEVGVGAILGAPFMLSTLAMFVTGVAVLSSARRRPTGDAMRVDTASSPTTCATSRSPTRSPSARPSCRSSRSGSSGSWPSVLLGIYAWYVKGHFEADPDVDAEDLAPLRFHRLDRGAHRDDPAVPRLRVVNLQVLVALGLIVLGAVFFVDAVEHLATQFGVDELLLALVIAPIATELPEKFNSVIWVRQGKDTLAMGNITGAMVFQSTIPTVVALVFASSTWVVDRGLVHRLRVGRDRVPVVGGDLHPDGPRGRLRGRGLLVGGVFYLVYLALVVGARRRGAVGSDAAREEPADILGRPQSQEPDRMLTEKSDETRRRPTHHAPAPGALDDLICYFEGECVPMRDAKVSIMTHAFMYGTATFEGIRAYWNADQGQLYGLKLREHVERIRQSCRILLMEDVPSVDELTRLIVETVRRNGFREDAYIRPVVLQVDPGDRRPAPRPRERAVHHRPAVRELHRHRSRRPGHDLVLAAQRRRGAPGPRQDRRRLREHGLPEVRGRAQRLRRGARPDRRRPRQRGVGGQRVRRPRRRRAHAAGQRRPARGRDPQGA